MEENTCGRTVLLTQRIEVEAIAEVTMPSTETLAEVIIGTSKPGLATTIVAEVILAEDLEAEVSQEEGTSKIATLEEAEDLNKNSFTNINTSMIIVTIALSVPTRALDQGSAIGTATPVKIFTTTISREWDMVIINTDNQERLSEKCSSWPHQHQQTLLRKNV